MNSLSVDGRWTRAAADLEIPDPMTGETMVLCPDTQVRKRRKGTKGEEET